MTTPQPPSVPAGRYGPVRAPARLSWGRLGLLTLGSVVAGFVIWLAVGVGTDPVRWQDVGYEVHDDGRAVDIVFDVIMRPGEVADCRVHALASSFAEVGVRDVVVGPGTTGVLRQRETIATSEPAVTAVVERCRPREG